MKLVIQRVSSASITIHQKKMNEINIGYVVLLGIHQEDTTIHCNKWIDKLLKIRLFPDDNKPINRSIQEVNGEILVVSQFTLYADTSKGNRPSFRNAADPNKAIELYDYFIKELKKKWHKVKTGEFGADMKIALVNDGPVTILLED